MFRYCLKDENPEVKAEYDALQPEYDIIRKTEGILN